MSRRANYIVEGNPSPHDILRIKGMEELATYLVKEIQDVYRLQGVKINDKHIEVICRQMMQKLEVIDGGDTTLIAGEHVDTAELEEANQKAESEGRKGADGRAILLGITKASLQTPFGVLGGLVPGDHPRPHRRGGQRQGRYAGRPEGECHRRTSHSGRHRRRHRPACAISRPNATRRSRRKRRAQQPIAALEAPTAAE